MVGVPVLKLLRQWPICILAPPPMTSIRVSGDWLSDTTLADDKSLPALLDGRFQHAAELRPMPSSRHDFLSEFIP